MSDVYVHYAERKQSWLHWLRSGVLSKMVENGNSGRGIAE